MRIISKISVQCSSRLERLLGNRITSWVTMNKFAEHKYQFLHLKNEANNNFFRVDLKMEKDDV